MSREISITEGTGAITHAASSKGAAFLPNTGDQTQFGRVIEIALTVSDQLFKDTNTLEAIRFEPVQDTTVFQESGDTKKTYLIAYKRHPSVRTPVLNEIVSIQAAPDLYAQAKATQFSEVYYYDHPVSVFNSVEHNATPDENTIKNLTPGAKKNKLDNYKSTSKGIKPVTNKSSTITDKDQVILGSYFVEKGIKSLAPLEGDYKLEGRFGNSLRFGGTPSSAITKDLNWSGPVGNPITILRNGQQSLDANNSIVALHEDINKDGSSVYMLQGHSIDFVLGSNNFDTYKQKISNTPPSNVVQQSYVKPPDNQSIDSYNPPEVDSLFKPIASVSKDASDPKPQDDDLNSVPDNEDDFNFVQIGSDVEVPLTQGVYLNKYSGMYKFQNGMATNATDNKNLVKANSISLSNVNAINSYAGSVTPLALTTKNGRALVDLVSLTEGTMGAGNFNGYDLIVGGSLLPGFNNINSAPPHPNIAIYIPAYNVKSTAAGRYQFIHRTWVTFAGADTTMSRANQDHACWKLILGGANVPTVMINKMDSDFEIFKKVINLMAEQWASLPVINDPKGLYGQAGRYTFDSLYTYYKQILSKY